jgi:hypothetical protein
LHVVEHLRRRESNSVVRKAIAQEVGGLAGSGATRIDGVLEPAAQRLAREAIHYGFDCVGLKGLLLEFELHLRELAKTG